MENLPQEIFLYIFYFLDLKDLLIFSIVDKKFNSLLKDPYIWKPFLSKYEIENLPKTDYITRAIENKRWKVIDNFQNYPNNKIGMVWDIDCERIEYYFVKLKNDYTIQYKCTGYSSTKTDPFKIFGLIFNQLFLVDLTNYHKNKNISLNGIRYNNGYIRFPIPDNCNFFVRIYPFDYIKGLRY